MSDKNKRLKAFFKDQGMTQVYIAKKLGVTQATVSALMNGKEFGKKTAQAWAEAFGLSPMWLMTGNGEMLKDPLKSDTALIFDDNNKTVRELIELLKNKDRQIDDLIYLLKQKPKEHNLK